MKIAVIGSGISGLVVAHRLRAEHDITIYEAADYIGGHSNTIDVERDGSHHPIDTGFIVFNERTYPNFCALLDELDVASQPTRMTFSVSCRETKLEYCGGNLNEVFAQRRNLLRPSFHRMLREILRFNREAKKLINSDDGRSLGQYLDDECYDKLFIRDYIIPMAAAIWSTDPELMFAFPAAHFVRFFENHGLLDLKDRPQWRTIVGGSRSYVEKLSAPFLQHIRLNTPVEKIKRDPDFVDVISADGNSERFDVVFVATHSDQALAILERPDRLEKETLSAIPYQSNTAVLHTDPALLPVRRRARAAWNYVREDARDSRVSLTYYMNILQSIDSPHDFCVTVNRDDDIDPSTVIKSIQYSHPVFTSEGVAAQRNMRDINGLHRTFFCGAYWGYGFHEDGVSSALTAIKHFEKDQHEKLHLRRTG